MELKIIMIPGLKFSLLSVLSFFMLAGFASADEAFFRMSPAERRAEVVRAIGKGSEGFGILGIALEDENVIIRRAAVRGLAGSGAAAAELLGKALADDDPDVRLIALTALRDAGKLTAAQAMAALEDENSMVREAAFEFMNILKAWDFLPAAPPGALDMLQFNFLGGTNLAGIGPSGMSLEVASSADSGFQGALIPSHPALTPEGGFSIRVWINPGDEFAGARRAYLADKMSLPSPPAVRYLEGVERMKDYMLFLSREGGGHSVIVKLGFGREGGVSVYRSEPVEFRQGEWHHVAFTYDGMGAGKIYVDGRLAGENAYPGRESIEGGGRDLFIGGGYDRSARAFYPFPGYIDKLQILDSVIEVNPENYRH